MQVKTHTYKQTFVAVILAFGMCWPQVDIASAFHRRRENEAAA